MPPWLIPSAAGYVFGRLSGLFESEGVTTSKLILGAFTVAGTYYIIKKAGK